MKLKNYIQGKRRGKEANELERKALQDPFLQDALDGFDSVDGDHFATIEELEKRFAQQPKRLPRRIWIWAAAAMIAIFLGTQVYMWIQHDRVMPPVVVLSETKTQDDVVAETIIEPIKPIETAKEPEIIAQSKLSKKPATQIQAKPETDAEQKKIILSDEITSETAETKKTEEIIVADYGVQKKSETTGAIQSIEGKNLSLDTNFAAKEDLTSNFTDKMASNALQGNVAGVRVESSDRNIRIRGASTIPSIADSRLVKGRILDETGEPLIGASVVLKNSTNGAITDIDGNFMLQVPNNQSGTLTASYIGYNNQEVAVAPNVGDIQLKSDLAQLDEVVVVGYGTKRQLFPRKAKVSDQTVLHPVSTSNLKPIENENQFIEFFKDNYDKSLCAGQKTKINASVSIDIYGRPTQLDIHEITCPEMKKELIRLLENSPEWTKKGRKMRLKFEL